MNNKFLIISALLAIDLSFQTRASNMPFNNFFALIRHPSIGPLIENVQKTSTTCRDLDPSNPHVQDLIVALRIKGLTPESIGFQIRKNPSVAQPSHGLSCGHCGLPLPDFAYINYHLEADCGNIKRMECVYDLLENPSFAYDAYTIWKHYTENIPLPESLAHKKNNIRSALAAKGLDFHDLERAMKHKDRLALYMDNIPN